MNDQDMESVEQVRDVDGDFCPAEIVDKVEDLFIIRERDGRTIERQLGIRRGLFEKGLRHAINRYRDPNGPRPMRRAAAASGRLELMRRSA